MQLPTTLQGRPFGPEQLAQIQALIGQNCGWSSYQLSRELARLWDWRTPRGQLKDMAARRALIALRDDAKPALPALAALMDSDSEDIALRAMIATLGTGTNAMPCLLKGFTNRSPVVRSEAAHFITDWGAQLPEQREQAVPYMIRILSDPDENVRRNVTNNLQEVDPEAAAKAGITVNRTHAPRPGSPLPAPDQTARGLSPSRRSWRRRGS